MTDETKPGGMKPRKTLVVVNTGSTKKRFIFQKLNKMDHLIKVVVVSGEENWAEPYVDEWILADLSDHEQVIRKVQDYASKHRVDGVITFWEDDVLLASKLVDRLKLPGIPFRVARKVRNKAEFRKFCAEHGLPTPKFIKISDEGDVERVKSELKFPVVVKPVFGASSAYVIKVEEAEDLDRVYRFVRENLSERVESALHEGSEIVVEEYIDGDEVDVDMILQHGKVKFWSVMDNAGTQEPFFMETEESLPSSLPDQAQLKLVRMAEETLEKLGVMQGCIHFEAKYTNKGPVPVEINLRMGGDETYPFVKKVWHVDLIERAVEVALGQFVPYLEKPEEPFSYMISRSVIPEESGILTRVKIPEKFNKNWRVEEVEFYKELGDAVLAPPDSYDFLGLVMVSGDNDNDARENLEAVYRLVDYDIAPFSPESSLGKTERESPLKAAIMKSSAKGRAKIERIRYLRQDDQRKLRIGLACNTYDGQTGVESELTAVGENIQKVLEERNYQVTYIDFNHIDKAIGIIKTGEIDLVFNVGERLNNSSLLEPHIAALLDAFQIPYTGSNPFTLGLCIDKIKVKKLLNYHNIPTADWDYAYDLKDEIRSDLNYPLIVKPGNTDNSIGINNESVVTNKRDLKRQLEYVLTEMKRPALVEEYLDGDEYDVSILGSEADDLKVLPLSRTVFEKLPQGYWHIYPYEKKFAESPVYDQALVVERPPRNVPRKLQALISEIALDTYKILDCHDYGRVEVKLDSEGNPYVLELNPNPSINIKDCVPAVAKLVGMDYGDFLEEIMALAIKRYKNKPPYYHLQSNIL